MTLSNAMNQQCRQSLRIRSPLYLKFGQVGWSIAHPSVWGEAANGGIILSSWLASLAARSDKKNTTSENAPRKGACSLARSLAAFGSEGLHGATVRECFVFFGMAALITFHDEHTGHRTSDLYVQTYAENQLCVDWSLSRNVTRKKRNPRSGPSYRISPSELSRNLEIF